MNDQIKQIAARVRGLRDVLELSEEEVAETCQMSLDDYRKMESGTVDISVSTLQCISRRYGIALGVLMFGEEPKMSSYFLTRADTGLSVERRSAYKYQSLASGFRGRIADPFIVTVSPKEDTNVQFNSHPGQEFNLVLEGRMLLCINGKKLYLNEGDSIYFDSEQLHGMLALDGKPVKFLAIIM